MSINVTIETTHLSQFISSYRMDCTDFLFKHTSNSYLSLGKALSD